MSEIAESLDRVAKQREVNPGRPEDGPYPATVGEVADEVVAWIDRMSDSAAHRLNHAVLRRLLPPGLLDELDDLREVYVSDQVSRQLAHVEGDMTRTQVDMAEIDARMRWDNRGPSSARLRKIVRGAP